MKEEGEGKKEEGTISKEKLTGGGERKKEEDVGIAPSLKEERKGEGEEFLTDAIMLIIII